MESVAKNEINKLRVIIVSVIANIISLLYLAVLLLVLAPILTIGVVNVLIPSPVQTPAYTIKEFIELSDPNSLIAKRIILIGNVSSEINSTGFYLTDPEDTENSSYIVFIFAANVEKPVGFEQNRIVVVEGKPLSKSAIWGIQASRISTKCPSTYD